MPSRPNPHFSKPVQCWWASVSSIYLVMSHLITTLWKYWLHAGYLGIYVCSYFCQGFYGLCLQDWHINLTVKTEWWGVWYLWLYFLLCLFTKQMKNVEERGWYISIVVIGSVITRFVCFWKCGPFIHESIIFIVIRLFMFCLLFGKNVSCEKILS